MPLFHLSLEDEQLSKLDSSENKSNESSQTNRRPSIEKETVIQLPRGTIIKIGEEKQEPSKPGRKRKGLSHDSNIKPIKFFIRRFSSRGTELLWPNDVS